MSFPTLDFTLPTELEASAPIESRGTGLRRDDVRLMVSHLADDRIQHAHFRNLADFLDPGDVLVINTSGTLNAALPGRRADGVQYEIHLSTQLPNRQWTVEIRQLADETTRPYFDLEAGEVFTLPANGRLTLHQPYCGLNVPICPQSRLWTASLELPQPLHSYLETYGFPIRYGYVPQPWPSDFYQTAYATQLGSAEMPSAGRAFTPELITQLVARGIQFAPLVLHTGVASQEAHEPPYAEQYCVSEATADRINQARARGKRVIAVGTTAVRALETVTDAQGTHPSSGWTELVITPERGIRAVDSLLTGLHEPEATHLALLAALSGLEHLKHTYAAALAERYLWHEFGDVHLILGGAHG